MRILHLPSSFLPESVGGTEIYVDRLCRAQVETGHVAAVFYHSESAASSGAGEEVGYRVYRAHPHRPQKRVDLYRRSAFREPEGFAEVLEDFRPDIVHFHALTLGCGVDHAKVVQDRGIPYAATYHTPAMSCPRGTMLLHGVAPCDGAMQVRRCAQCTLEARGWRRPFAKIGALSPFRSDAIPDGPWVPRATLPDLLRLMFESTRRFFLEASAVIACADWCRDVLVANDIPAARITVLRQAVPGDSRVRRLRLPVRRGGPLRIGYFGRIGRVKGPDLLIEAAELLRERGFDLECELAGPIERIEQSWFEARLRRCQSFARHLGLLRDGALEAWLDDIDLLAIPSRWLETGPLTLLEAWDRGVPVVGADRGGIRDFFVSAGLDWMLFDAESVSSLAGAIERVVSATISNVDVRIRGFRQLAAEIDEIYHAILTPARLQEKVA